MADDKEREPEEVDQLIGDLEAHAAEEELPSSAPGEGDTNTCTCGTCTCADE